MKFGQEVIGLDIEITGAKNNSLIGIRGRVIDESRNSILIKNSKRRRVIKEQITSVLIERNSQYK